MAILAGLVMFPALFAFGLEPDAGPGLLFLTMTNLFARMPGGQLFGSAFFFLLLLAAITSAAAMHEVLTGTLTDLLPLKRCFLCNGIPVQQIDHQLDNDHRCRQWQPDQKSSNKIFSQRRHHNDRMPDLDTNDEGFVMPG